MVINLQEAILHLNQGGILIYPTDTVYGIGCLPQYVDKILEIKPRKSGFIVLVDRFDRYSHWIVEPFTPPNTDRPTTWVVKASRQVPQSLLSNGNIAIRQVSHKPTKSLLEKLNEPLISTSANLPKNPTPSTIEELEKEFIFPILKGENGGNSPSQIIHYQSKRIIRP